MFDGNPNIPIGHQRLLQLADRLDHIKPENFSICHWAKGKKTPVMGQDDQPTCGTVVCAGGLAALMYADHGLFLTKRTDYSDVWDIQFSGRESYEALSLFFEISDLESERLFKPMSYRLPPLFDPIKATEVSSRIRELVHARATIDVR